MFPEKAAAQVPCGGAPDLLPRNCVRLPVSVQLDKKLGRELTRVVVNSSFTSLAFLRLIEYP